MEELKGLKDPSILLIWKAPQGISIRNGRLGIFPASFNPPTNVHLTLVREAKKRFDLDEILILLDIHAMDKRLIGATLEDRLIMLKTLFQRDPKISIGLSNQGLFIQKLKPLRELYPIPIAFNFIVGFDTILRVMDKKYYKNRKRALDKLFEQSRFLVANRGDKEREAFKKLFEEKENRRYERRVSFFALPKRYSSFSSSLVRKRIREGKSVRTLVPATILRFIEKTGLYS